MESRKTGGRDVERRRGSTKTIDEAAPVVRFQRLIAAADRRQRFRSESSGEPCRTRQSAAPEPRREDRGRSRKVRSETVSGSDSEDRRRGIRSGRNANFARPSAKTFQNCPRPRAADSGAADFRKGEAYLYRARRAEETGDQAVQYLKAASNNSSAKAEAPSEPCMPRPLCAARSADILSHVCTGTASGSQQSGYWKDI